jgi:hypothetical protein
MAGDPAILKRIRACPFARGGRVLVRFRANGHSLFARRSGEPLARLRLTGNGDRGECREFRVGADTMSLKETLDATTQSPGDPG